MRGRLVPGSAFSKLCLSVLPSMAMSWLWSFPLIARTKEAKHSQNRSGSMAVKTRRKVSSLGSPPRSLRRLRNHDSRALAKRSKSSNPSLPQIMAARAMKMISPK